MDSFSSGYRGKIEMEPKILVVDDEERFLHYLSKRLMNRNFDVTSSPSGEDAVEKVKHDGFDVIIMDVIMPGISGLEALAYIKELSKTIEVILLTAHASTQDGVEGIKSGAFDYMTKPVEMDHLVSKIRQAHEKILREEEKKREADFRARMEQRLVAAERLASLGTLATGVAHEINNPLAVINDAAGLLKDLLGKEEFAEIPLRNLFEKSVDKIEKNVDRAKKITHQLLGFVQKTDAPMSEVNLREIGEEAVQRMAKEAESKDIRLLLKVQSARGGIRSDPYRLRQVLIHLLTNAVHATGKGGRITVTIEEKEGEAVLTVQDTGEGIEEENLERIFEPFFSTKSTGEGTGLGLFVAQEIVDKLGGKIEVESQMGHGATFTVRIPKTGPFEKILNQQNRVI
jgi:signal transduction histidine kinase